MKFVAYSQSNEIFRKKKEKRKKGKGETLAKRRNSIFQISLKKSFF